MILPPRKRSRQEHAVQRKAGRPRDTGEMMGQGTHVSGGGPGPSLEEGFFQTPRARLLGTSSGS